MAKRKRKEPRTKVTFYIPTKLYRSFKVIAAGRGHTLTWYLTGCVNEVVKGERGRGKRRKSSKKIPASE